MSNLGYTARDIMDIASLRYCQGLACLVYNSGVCISRGEEIYQSRAGYISTSSKNCLAYNVDIHAYILTYIFFLSSGASCEESSDRSHWGPGAEQSR